jgi:DNA-binding beta-propeller fold protein YncE
VNDDRDLRNRVRRALDAVHRPNPDLVRRAAAAVERDRLRRRVPAAAAWSLVSLLAVGALVAALLVHQVNREQPGPVATATPATTTRTLLFALTAGNQVIALDQSSMAVRWRAQAGPAPAVTLSPGSLMALSPDGTRLYVLAPQEALGGTTVTTFDAGSGRVVASVALAAPGGALYRTLAVQPRTGTVYAVGQDQQHILVTAIDPVRRVVLATQATRALPAKPARGVNVPFRAAVTADGSRLYYSYGAEDTDRSGIDWVDLRGAGFVPCRSSGGGAACRPGFGQGFVLAGDRVLSVDRSLSPQVVETTRDGAVVRRSATDLTGAARDLAFDAAHNRLIVLGECGNQGGLDLIDRPTGRLTAVTTPVPGGTEADALTPCGLSPTLLPGGELAVSRVVAGQAHPDQPGRIDVIDLASGRVLRSATLPAEVADLLSGG